MAKLTIIIRESGVAGGTSSELSEIVVTPTKSIAYYQIDDIVDGMGHSQSATKEKAETFTKYFFHQWGNGSGEERAAGSYRPGLKFLGSLDFAGDNMLLLGMIKNTNERLEMSEEGLEMDKSAEVFQAKHDQKQRNSDATNNNSRLQLYRNGKSAAQEKELGQYESDGTSNGKGLDTFYYDNPK